MSEAITARTIEGHWTVSKVGGGTTKVGDMWVLVCAPFQLWFPSLGAPSVVRPRLIVFDFPVPISRDMYGVIGSTMETLRDAASPQATLSYSYVRPQLIGAHFDTSMALDAVRAVHFELACRSGWHMIDKLVPRVSVECPRQDIREQEWPYFVMPTGDSYQFFTLWPKEESCPSTQSP